MSAHVGMERILERARASMQGSLLPWYQGLSLREQRLVTAAVLLFCIGFVAFGIVMPLQHKEASMQQQVVRLADQAREAAVLADRLQQGGSAPKADLLSAVEQVAVRSGVRRYMTRIRPQTGADGGRQLTLQLKAVPYAKVIAFVAALHHRHVGLVRLRMQAADRPGYVHVEAVASGS